MIEILVILLVLIFAFGQAHMPLVGGLFWFLDSADGVETTWSFDTFLTNMLFPLSLLLVSFELFLLFRVL